MGFSQSHLKLVQGEKENCIHSSSSLVRMCWKIILPFQDAVLPSAVGHQPCLSASGWHLHSQDTYQRRGAGLLEEKWQFRSSTREGSNVTQDGMYKCLFLAPKYLLLLQSVTGKESGLTCMLCTTMLVPDSYALAPLCHAHQAAPCCLALL